MSTLSKFGMALIACSLLASPPDARSRKKKKRKPTRTAPKQQGMSGMSGKSGMEQGNVGSARHVAASKEWAVCRVSRAWAA